MLARDTGDIAHFTVRDFCQTKVASDVISGTGENGDHLNTCANFGNYPTSESLEGKEMQNSIFFQNDDFSKRKGQ